MKGRKPSFFLSYILGSFLKRKQGTFYKEKGALLVKLFIKELFYQEEHRLYIADAGVGEVIFPAGIGACL